MTNTPAKPPLTVWLGPTGSGKTRACLDACKAAPGQALLLVPSKPYADRLRSQAEEETVANCILPFGEWVRDVAGRKSEAAEMVSRTLRHLILREICERNIGPDDYFSLVRCAPGFSDALTDCIQELKLSCVRPVDLEAAADEVSAVLESGTFARKAREIAQLYAAYEEILEGSELLDEEALPTRAAQRVRAGEAALDTVEAVYIDGFYRLSPAWRALLLEAASHSLHITVTLPYEAGRPNLFATSARTLQALGREFDTRLKSVPAVETGAPLQLRTLQCRLFSASPLPDPPSSLSESAGSVRILDAPNLYTEVEMVARELLREKAAGVNWRDCALILRSCQEYAPILQAVFDRYEIPLDLPMAASLAEHPLARTVLTLFDVLLNRWQREDVIAVLRSTYAGCNSLAADSLRLQAKRRGLREGREAWRAFVDRLDPAADRAADSAAGSAAGVLAGMMALDRRLLDRERSAAEFGDAIAAIWAVDGLLSHVDDERSYRAVAKQMGGAIDDVAHGVECAGGSPLRFAEYARKLRAAWESMPCPATSQEDAVHVIEPYDVGQLDARFAAVMGLTERVFPRRVMEDPFFRDDERRALAERTGIHLELRNERVDEERLLFYLSVSAPSGRLVLSFPRASEEADTLPSFYLDEVRAALPNVETIATTLADVAPPSPDCLTDHDRLLAQCAASEQDSTPRPDLAAVLATRDRPPLPALEDTALAAAYAVARPYRITEIESYNRCPFRHFAQYAVRLRAETGGAGAAEGALVHAALRRASRKRVESGQPARKDLLAEAYRAELSACLAKLSIDAPPHRKKMMEQSLLDALEEFAEREERYAELFGLLPAWFELAFGHDDEDDEDDEDEDDEEDQGDDEELDRGPRDYDPASTSRPLVIDGEDGREIHLCGTIDRVDRTPDGRKALVLDYKLGNSVEWDHIKQGKSLQVPLYMAAVEELWGLIAAVACYNSPRDSGRRRFFRTGQVDQRSFAPIVGVEHGSIAKPLGPADHADMMETAKTAVRTAVAGIRAGDILPRPGEHCRGCDYSDICRTGRDQTHDGEPYPTLDGPAP